MPSQIIITNSAEKAVIDIEGIIGVPEWLQFDAPEERVSTYDRFKAAVTEIASVKAPDVAVNIRSTGGSVNDALLIYDTLKELPGQVTTRCYGYTASAATVIAQAATVGRRFISSNSLYLIHRSSSIAAGTADEITSVLTLVQQTDERIADIYATASGRPREMYSDLMSENAGQGRWLSPQEALGYGLVDAVVESSQVYNYTPEQISACRLPQIPENLINDNPMKMIFKKTWNALLSTLGITATTDEVEHELQATDFEKVNETLHSLASERDALKTDVSNLTAERDRLNGELAQAKTTLSEVTAERDRLKASPTETEPREDPPIGDEPRTANAQSYEADIKNFK